MIQPYEKPVATVFLFTPREALATHNDDSDRLRTSVAPIADDDGFDAGTSLEDSIFG